MKHFKKAKLIRKKGEPWSSAINRASEGDNNGLGNPLLFSAGAQMASSNSTAITILAIGAVGIVLYFAKGLFGAQKSIFEATGISDSKEDIKTKKNIDSFEKKNQNDNPFSAGYYKDKKISITNVEAKAKADKIAESRGYFNDDETAIFTVFNSLKYKSDVSKIASIYLIYYKESLYTNLKSWLSKDELNTIIRIINTLL